jgi:hypothetical protein
MSRRLTSCGNTCTCSHTATYSRLANATFTQKQSLLRTRHSTRATMVFHNLVESRLPSTVCGRRSVTCEVTGMSLAETCAGAAGREPGQPTSRPQICLCSRLRAVCSKTRSAHGKYRMMMGCERVRSPQWPVPRRVCWQAAAGRWRVHPRGAQQLTWALWSRHHCRWRGEVRAAACARAGVYQARGSRQ